MGRAGPLRFGVDGDGFLTVVARRPGRGATLRFRPDGLQVVARRGEEVVLAWETARDISPMDLDPEGWRIRDYPPPWHQEHVGTGDLAVGCLYAPLVVLAFGNRLGAQWQPRGCAVAVAGSLAPAADHVAQASARRRLRYAGNPKHALIPVLAGPFTRAGAQCDTLGTLVNLLRARPELQVRLGDPECTRALAGSLQHASQTARMEPETYRRDTVDTLTAMRLAGAVHPYGRPLRAGDHGAFASLADAVTAVRARLDANPYRSDRASDPERVEMLVREQFWGVEPWPFGALLD